MDEKLQQARDFEALLPEPAELGGPIYSNFYYRLFGYPQVIRFWPVDWSERVDAYLDNYGGSRAALFRSISEYTGNTVNGLNLKYHARQKSAA